MLVGVIGVSPVLGGCASVQPKRVAASTLGAVSLATARPELGLMGAAIGFMPIGEPEYTPRGARQPLPWGGSNGAAWEAVYARPVDAPAGPRWDAVSVPAQKRADPPVPAGLH